MASRRTRIKGIANIPQRKKNTTPTENPPDSLTTEKPEEITQPELPIKSEFEDQNAPPSKPDTEKPPQSIKTEQSNSLTSSNDLPNPLSMEPETEKLPAAEDIKATKPLIRRKCFKPVINPNVIKQRTLPKEIPVTNNINQAPNVEESKVIAEPAPAQNNSVVIHNDVPVSNPAISRKVACDITKQISEASPSENQPVLNEENVSNVVFRNPEFLGSDTEYPGPPASPSKYNRGRIKAIPKLSLRKPSASESEDEGRKYYGRIRNNSVCSAVSVSNQEPQTPMSEEMFQKETVAPKKLFRTEQSRKLAEARREFYRKFGTNNPDKQKLKMIDLIYYNPTSNPMTKNSSQPNNNNNDDVENPPEPTEAETNNDNESDNDTALVPQIKIGPSGEIVLDEQSLVVENTQVNKQKEQIQNSKLVDGDSAGYGVYKRSPRATSWTQRETLRFYKALNVIGTDFTLMTQLFPKRSRRELKTKFKKEERSNLALVDKALKERCSYNFQDLKREVETDQEEENLLQQLQEEERQKEQDTFSKRSRTLPTITEQANLPFKKRQSSLQSNEEQPPQKKARKKRKRKLDIKSVIDDDESVADVSDFAQSDSECDFEEEEFIPYLKATRSGRMPKSTLQFNEPLIPLPQRQIKKPTPPKIVTVTPRSRTVSSTSSVESDSLIPGSVVITSEETEEGKSHYKAFMVTPQKKLTPVELESSVIDRLLKEGRNVTLPLGEGSDMVESNVTIVEGEADSVRPIKENENNVEIITEL